MKTLQFAPTPQTPKIILDSKNNHFEMSGKCLPEDAKKIFDPVLEWLDQFKTKSKGEIVFNFELDYFNTSSSKYLLDIFYQLESIHEKANTNVMINWICFEEDDDMQEAGEDYSEIVNVPIEVKIKDNLAN